MKRSPSRRKRPWEDITPHQYARGWELVSTGHTIQQIIAATALTKPQLVWLMKVGDEGREMPSYHSRIAEQSAAIRRRGMEAANRVGEGAVHALEKSAQITKLAQQYAETALAAHLNIRVRPMMQKLARNEATEDDLQAMAMPKGLRETLKMLRPYTDFSETAKAFRTVFESAHQGADPIASLPKEVRVDLQGEAMLPATVALIEELDHGEVGHDLLDDLLPEYKGWTAEQIENYLATGEQPPSSYGDVIDITEGSATDGSTQGTS